MSVRIKFNNWRILVTSTVLGQQHDQNSQAVTVTGDIPPEWDWYLLLGLGDQYNAYLMSQENGTLTVVLDETALPQSGTYQLQIKGISLEDTSVIRHTNVATVLVNRTITGCGAWTQSPIAFSEIEERIQVQAAQITQQANTVETITQRTESIATQCQEAAQSVQENTQQVQKTMETIDQQAEACQSAVSLVEQCTVQAVEAKEQSESAATSAQAAATDAQAGQVSATLASSQAQAYLSDTLLARDETAQYAQKFQEDLALLYTKQECINHFAGALQTNTSIDSCQEIYPDVDSSLVVTTYGYSAQLGAGEPAPDNIRPILTGGRQANLLNPEKLFPSPHITFDSKTGTITRSVTAGMNYDIFTGSVGLSTAVTDLSLILHLIPNHAYTVSIDSISEGSVYIRPVSASGTIVSESWKLNSDILSTEIVTTETGYITIRLEALSVTVAGLRLAQTDAPYSQYTKGELATFISIQGAEQNVTPLYLTEPLCAGDYVVSDQDGNCVEHHQQKVLILDGSEAWTEDTPGLVWKLSLSIPSKSAICSHFAQTPIAELRNGSIGMYATNSANLFIGYPADNIGEFKSFLYGQHQNGLPVTFVYMRCSPSSYDLDPIQYTFPSLYISAKPAQTGSLRIFGEHSIAVQYNQSISYVVKMIQKQLSSLQTQIDALISE